MNENDYVSASEESDDGDMELSSLEPRSPVIPVLQQPPPNSWLVSNTNINAMWYSFPSSMVQVMAFT